MISDEDAERLIARVVGLWPVARKNEEYQSSVRELLIGKREALTPDDLAQGFRLLSLTARTSRDDGGPAWPPSPGEVLGCLLTSARNRAAGNRRLPRRGSRKVSGRVCRKCQGELHFLPGDDVLHCAACNMVMGVGSGIRLSWGEVQSLEFADEYDIDPAEVEAAKERAMRYIRTGT